MIRYALFFLIVFNISHAVEFQGDFKQGSFILGKTDPKSKVFIDNRKIRVSKDGFFAFGLDRDRKNNVIIKIQNKKETKLIEKQVFKREYKIQRIDGLPPKQVTPPPEVYERIKKDNKLIGDARAINSNLIFFKDKFVYPIDKYIITGVYRSQRTYLSILRYTDAAEHPVYVAIIVGRVVTADIDNTTRKRCTKHKAQGSQAERVY